MASVGWWMEYEISTIFAITMSQSRTLWKMTHVYNYFSGVKIGVYLSYTFFRGPTLRTSIIPAVSFNSRMTR